MLNNNPKSKLRTMDAVKQDIFNDIKENFNKKFRKDIDLEDIFIVAETQQAAIEKAFEQGDNIRCMYLGTFKVQPNLVQLAELRREFIQAGFNPQDAHQKAKDQMDVILLDKYNQSMANNTYGKTPKKSVEKLKSKRVNKAVNLPFNSIKRR